MNTEELIGLLAADTKAVPRHGVTWRGAAALALGLPLSLLWVATEYGLRADLGAVAHTSPFWLKVGVPLALFVSGLVVLFRLGHPGMRLRQWTLGLWVPVLVWWLAAGFALEQAVGADRAALVWGTTWRVCTFNVVVTALPVGVAMFWWLRGLAPTRPGVTGAAAGWVAGAAGAAVYALHCPEMAAPFLAVWYVLGMGVCAALGALAGRWLLRW